MVDDVFTSRHVEFTDTCLSPCRLMCQLTSLMLPRKRRVSQEVTSERCVVTRPCSVSETLSTLRTTGTCLSLHLSVQSPVSLTCLSLSPPVRLSVHQRTSSVQSIRWTSTKRSVRWRNLNQQDISPRCTLLWTEKTHTHTPLPVCLYVCKYVHHVPLFVSTSDQLIVKSPSADQTGNEELTRPLLPWRPCSTNTALTSSATCCLFLL